MKKLIVLTGVIVAMTTFNSKNNPAIGQTPQQAVYYKTLNNIDQLPAEAMIASFKNNIFNKQSLPKLNFWFGMEVVTDIVNLIHNDLKAQAGQAHKVDGIRIYFASDVKTPSNVSLLLVTTVDSIDVKDPLGPVKHRDYYVHSQSEKLFTDNGISGEVYKPGQHGAKLYSVSNNTTDDNTCDFPSHPNYIKRSVAETMVRAFGNNLVNTRAEWFPSKVFEDLIKSASISDGIRIYFATHEGAVNPNDVNDLKGRDAFVIATTEADASDATNHNDYFDCRPPQKMPAKNITKPFKKSNLKPTNKNDLKGIIKHGAKWNAANKKESPDDNGSLCPNNCN